MHRIGHADASSSPLFHRHPVTPPLPRIPRSRRWWVLVLILMIAIRFLSNWSTLIPQVFAAPVSSSTPGTLTYQQFEQEDQRSDADQGDFQCPIDDPNALTPETNTMPDPTPQSQATVTTSASLPSSEPVMMQPLTYTLDDSFILHRPTNTHKVSALHPIQGTAIPAGTTPLDARGSDGRLEVQVPRGFLDLTHATLVGGAMPIGNLFLQVIQTGGHYLEETSILGTYTLQVVDGDGDVVQGVTLLHLLTLTYHYQPAELQELNLNPNEIGFAWSGALAQAELAKTSLTGLMLPATNNAQARTLTVQTTQLAGPLTVSGMPELEQPATPDLFEGSGNAGQYSYTYPLSVVPGPGGFAPDLALSYDALNDLVSESGSNGTQEQYVYDPSGYRVLTRSTSASTTTLTTCAFKLQDLTFTASGTFSSEIAYYLLGMTPVASTDGSTPTLDLTDAEGSVLLSLSATAIQGEQASGPGNQRYSAGSISTPKRGTLVNKRTP